MDKMSKDYSRGLTKRVVDLRYETSEWKIV